jgi:uncharacterized Zn finger protein (UPF0148 family)
MIIPSMIFSAVWETNIIVIGIVQDLFGKRKLMSNKKCSVCKITKSILFFDKNGETKFSSRCKECQRLKNLKYREDNSVKVRESKLRWYEKNKELIINKTRLKRKSDPRANMLATAKHRAKVNSLPFSIVSDDIVIPEYCPILKIALKTNEGVSHNDSPSLDKIVPELGYVKGNIQVISKLANSMKTNASIQELKLFAKWVLETFKENND